MTIGTGIAICGVSAAVAVIAWRDPVIAGCVAFCVAFLALLATIVAKG